MTLNADVCSSDLSWGQLERRPYLIKECTLTWWPLTFFLSSFHMKALTHAPQTHAHTHLFWQFLLNTRCIWSHLGMFTHKNCKGDSCMRVKISEEACSQRDNWNEWGGEVYWLSLTEIKTKVSTSQIQMIIYFGGLVFVCVWIIQLVSPSSITSACKQ